MWNLDDILSLLVSALRAEHDRLTGEQAVHNLDALDEVALHPILCAALGGVGLGVLREQAYPSEWLSKPGRRRKALPDESQRLRCDLVLTHAPGQPLIDPLRHQRALLEDLALAERTLFAQPARARAAEAPPGVPPSDACWLELKVVGQFCHTAGVPEANRQYASHLVRSVAGDLKKLACDPSVVHAGVALVLFTASHDVARHDLGVVTRRCAQRDLLRALPRVESFPIVDRIGNTACTVALFVPRAPHALYAPAPP